MKNRDYNFYVYILTNYTKKVFYIGVTNSLIARINIHKEKINKNSFTSKYNCVYLVYYEHFTYYYTAFLREKQLKKWRREKKANLINKFNPDWKDLYGLITG
ncbi:hypothetical protein CVU82_03495 [Candidatus Falkowbacteria bacterium HGW-Falkowbacteria-1]|jgi:putative endonuclease|uniref:GIY-YIG domain-containing protein n=1 Tax=Candidatus Falkowbacteria bacterium HGW-Falkowbacteria-1 TaxID=2013768 RepID=A0A2N2E8M1_9BACT|nr:MAG: hypothetical protein CVU82_03495 [Candidatus Falkowbacteria bacterium HGW-Falkowbacteria-1]